MNIWHIATRSLRYYWSTNLAIALGVAAATAVLTGALIVGDSMRNSLRELTLERLGKIDELLVSDGFFREKFADEIAQTKAFQASYDQIAPAIMFPGGTVETESSTSAEDVSTAIRYAGQVTVLGVDKDFWNFDSRLPNAFLEKFAVDLKGDRCVVNQALADDLGFTAEDIKAGNVTVTVRVPKQNQLPADSALGRKTDLIESLVELEVIAIVPNQGLGRFGMFPTQADPLNVFVPIKLLQDSLARSVLKHKADARQANMLLLSGRGNGLPAVEITNALRDSIQPSMADLGLQLNPVSLKHSVENQSPETIFEYTSLSSDKLVISDEAADSIEKAFPNAKPVFTYLANDIRKTEDPSGIPFSMVAGIDFDDETDFAGLFQFRPISAKSGKPIARLAEDEIVVNEWAAEDLEIAVGEKVAVTFFEPESTHGTQAEQTVEFTVADVAKITTPDRPFGYSRREGVIPPVYDRMPTVANDPDLTPMVPGVTDAESIEEWDLPFSTADKLRAQDDDYWENFRTTPKAFVNLTAARKLFNSRFGQTTSFRISTTAGDVDEVGALLLHQFAQDDAKLGLHSIPIKRRGLAASSGSTPFDVLFLALSMFVIGSALILVSLLFRLSLQQRASEVGLFKAIGFAESRLRKTWLTEMLLVSLVGAIIGVALGVGYAALMIQGLTTWWVGAIARPFLSIHVSWVSLAIGLGSGLLACIATIAVSLRRSRKQPVIKLLRGELESLPLKAKPDRSRLLVRALPWGLAICAIGLAAVAIGLAAVAIGLAGEPQAGAFMGAGFLLLAAGLMFVYRWLARPETAAAASTAPSLSLSQLALLSAKRNPLRSTLTIGLVAVASFLITAVSSFRLSPTDRGTAGFEWVATSSQPVFENLQTVEGQSIALGDDNLLPESTRVFSLRYKSGEDASCNNLYQSTQPRALGVPPNFTAADLQFGWAGSLAEGENKWTTLGGDIGHAGTAEDPVPVVLDKNTANYSLKIFALGTVKEVRYDSGESLHFKVVGFLENTILQGSLLMSERDFVSAFPSVAGYQYFLIDDGAIDNGVGQQPNSGAGGASKSVQILEDRLSDLGFDARSAPNLLASFMSVQNTYLSTFQTLGALGLLLGTIGLAAVQVRSVLERKQELGLMRAVGFQLEQLSSLVMLENAWLLFAGLAVGIGSAMLTTLPHWLVGAASIPWSALVAIFASIAVVGLLAGWFASRKIGRVPLLESLRG
jgi:ABC-type antimicrobial peptide transport system permease subunit